MAGSGGHFSIDNANPWYPDEFPGLTLDAVPAPKSSGGNWTEGSNYVLQAAGTITIASAGYYTFGVDSDGGFSLAITGADFTSLTNATNSTGGSTMAYTATNPRTAADTLGTTHLAAGSYPVSLLYYHNSGAADLEFYIAAYSASSSAGVTSFASNSILVGDTTATNPTGGTSTRPPRQSPARPSREPRRWTATSRPMFPRP